MPAFTTVAEEMHFGDVRGPRWQLYAVMLEVVLDQGQGAGRCISGCLLCAQEAGVVTQGRGGCAILFAVLV